MYYYVYIKYIIYYTTFVVIILDFSSSPPLLLPYTNENLQKTLRRGRANRCSGDRWGEDGHLRLLRDEKPRCGTDYHPQEGIACDGDTKPVPATCLVFNRDPLGKHDASLKAAQATCYTRNIEHQSIWLYTYFGILLVPRHL